TFTYTFIPLEDMDEIWLMRQAKHPAVASDLQSNPYPSHTLPKITSHIHPKFALFALAYHLADIKGESREAVHRQWPFLSKVRAVYSKWMAAPPSKALSDPTYIDPNVNLSSNMDDIDEGESDGDRIATGPRPRRVPY
ncbi:hypothetical protein BKA70DRAFT_1034220, partial [Coprinopsis sp. MPI-PUGE-AT-0042]